jgi:hypothetical protein
MTPEQIIEMARKCNITVDTADDEVYIAIPEELLQFAAKLSEQVRRKTLEEAAKEFADQISHSDADGEREDIIAGVIHSVCRQLNEMIERK